MRYYIADCHFFHHALNYQMDNRGFATAAEMNEYMLTRWNEKVRWNDEVIILGDLSYGNAEETNELVSKLNGLLYLVQGNHDPFGRVKGYHTTRFKWIRPYAELHDNKRKVILCHYPIVCYNGQYLFDEDGNPRTYMLYGHVHNTADEQLIDACQKLAASQVRTRRDGSAYNLPCQMINCFCGFSDYTPLTLDEWIACDAARRRNTLH